MDASPLDPNNVLWLFGYSSLIWKYEEVDYDETMLGHVEGFRRRFWQTSVHHRGSIEQPGLVASLYSKAEIQNLNIKEENETAMSNEAWRVHGRLFKISGTARDRVISSLNDREVGGYVHQWIPVYSTDEHGTKVLVTPRALTYIAQSSNAQFTGYLSHEDIVSRILKSTGVSGTNREYLENLAQASESSGATDSHLVSLMSLLPP